MKNLRIYFANGTCVIAYDESVVYVSMPHSFYALIKHKFYWALD